MVDLGGFGGTCTAANDLNNQGQVVGLSTVAGDAFQRAFLWEHGSIHDLGGSLGGNNTGAFVLNDDGQAVGFAALPGEATYHATLWRHVGKMTDLGTVGNDQCSYATGINAREQVVGGSISVCNSDSATFRAFLWESGSLFDLNALIPSGSPVYLQQVETINDSWRDCRHGSGWQRQRARLPIDPVRRESFGCRRLKLQHGGCIRSNSREHGTGYARTDDHGSAHASTLRPLKRCSQDAPPSTGPSVAHSSANNRLGGRSESTDFSRL